VYFAVRLMNFIPAAVIQNLSFTYIVQFSFSYKRVGKGKVLQIFIVVYFWAFDALEIMLLMHVIFPT
jgi:hypothetical protein